MTVEFRVLGPVEIRRDGAPIPLRAPVQRALLAALLIGHNRVVSVDQLAEAIWSDEQPGSKHALEMTVSRVRRLLGADAAVVARAPGYVLDVDPATIDSVRFERLLGEARELAEADPVRAAARARAALALWRGDAFAEFAFAEFARPEISRLDELRDEAQEEWLAAEIAAGRSSAILGELETLTAAEPLRERRQALLMRALYASGRQAEALAVYRRTRRHLLDKLGLEPGVELRELEQAILRQDASIPREPQARAVVAPARRPATVLAVEPDIALDLDVEEHERRRRALVELVDRVADRFDALRPEPFILAFAHEDHAQRAVAAAAELGERVGVATGDALVGEGSVVGPVVELARLRARTGTAGEVPAPSTHASPTPFVGREQELELLRNVRCAVVVGPPGIGKSRLARELSPAAVFARCRSHGSESLAPLRELAASLDTTFAVDAVPATELPLAFRRLCERVAPVTVVFDDVQSADSVVLDVIEHLGATAAVDVQVLALARDELLEERPAFLPSATRVRLAPLALADAVLLAGDERIAERAEGNPLFIEQLLAHATETGERLPRTLHALLASRLDALTPTERDAVERAAIFGRDFDAELIGARSTLDALVRKTLLERTSPTTAFEERYRFVHGLVHDAAYSSITREERARLHEEAADSLADRAAHDEEVGFHLERAAEFRGDSGRHTQRLAEDAGRRLGAAGIAAMKRSDLKGAIALLERSTRLRPDPELACELGLALNTVGRSEDARAAFDAAADCGDRRVAARARLERAISTTTDPDEVLRAGEEAIRVADALEDERARGRAWLLTGWVRGGALGRHAEWLDAAERAMEHYERAGWPPSTCVGHIAAALYYGPAPVETATKRCAALRDAPTDLSADASVSAYLGGLLAMACAWDESDALLRHARDVYDDLGRAPSLTRTCAPIEARCARLRGDVERAAAILEASCEQLLAESASFHLASQAAELADALAALGDTDAAQRWCDVAVRHVHDHDIAAALAIATARMRLLAHSDRDREEARAHAASMLDVASTTDNLNARAAAHLAAALVVDPDANVQTALELYRAKGNAAAAEAAAARRSITSRADRRRPRER